MLRTLILSLATLAAPLALADPVPAPRLGAATNFGQAWAPDMLDGARQLPVTDFRDAVYWRAIEKTNGRYDFSGARRSYPDRLEQQGAGMSLTVNNGHPGYDNGHTPITPEAVAAFARFAVAALDRFPAIHTVEVGNEMNSDTFVSGPGWDTDLTTRAVSYTALLAETARAVRARHPEVRILGGAAHSIPLFWFEALFDAGAAAHMDALVIHPYGVAPEDLRALVGQLHTLPDAAGMPIEVTEFGHEDATIAPAHLLKNYCQMALAGVDRVIWYPLNPRGDGLAALLSPEGEVTPVGRTYQIIARDLAAGMVHDIAPDAFTYGCQFGANAMVLWGEPRGVTLVGDDIRVLDPEGTPVARDGLRLSMDRPLIVLRENEPLSLGTQVQLAPQQVIADSWHQFAFPGGTETDPFDRMVARGTERFALELRQGQQKNGVPWVPYLGTRMEGVLRGGAEWVLPSRPKAGPLDVVYRYQNDSARAVQMQIEVAPSSRSEDGVDLIIRRNGRDWHSQTVTEAETVRFDTVDLGAGEVLEFAIGPRATARGDVTRFRVTLRQPG